MESLSSQKALSVDQGLKMASVNMGYDSTEAKETCNLGLGQQDSLARDNPRLLLLP